MDEIIVESLSIAAYIGVNQWEQKIKQNLLIDIHLYSDLSNVKDNINETIDYDSLCLHINDIVTQTSFQLIETVANEIAIGILNQFPIKQVKIAVNKPHALRQAKNVKVIVTRSR